MTTKEKLNPIEQLEVEDIGFPRADLSPIKESDNDYAGMRIIAEVNDLKQMTALRKNVVTKMIYFLFAYTTFVAFATILSGFKEGSFEITDTVLLTLWSGTFGQVIGVITLIIKGLFFIKK